jgi:hypothetical protein
MTLWAKYSDKPPSKSNIWNKASPGNENEWPNIAENIWHTVEPL